MIDKLLSVGWWVGASDFNEIDLIDIRLLCLSEDVYNGNKTFCILFTLQILSIFIMFTFIAIEI